MDTRTKVRAKGSKLSSGFFKSIHRLPTKFVKDCGFIPIVLINAASMVERYIKTKEIFQTQGTLSKAYTTLNLFSQGKRLWITRNMSVHDAVEAIKLVLTSLPEPLIPEDVCDSLITASRENSADQYGVILGKFRKKSPLNFGILHFMMILLNKVSLHTHHNLMDVRKLATVFVLDVIKPLKLDDPNDGEFLSERMQRLPYLIMVVEKLIFNVDIFKTCRNLKPDVSVVAASKALNELMFANSSGSGDFRWRSEERPDLNHCESARYSPRNVAPPAGPKRTCVPGNAATFLTGSGREKGILAPKTFAKISKSVATCGRDVRNQLQKTTSPGTPLYHISPTSTKLDSLSTLDSTGFLSPSRGPTSKVFNQSSRSARLVSKPSNMPQKVIIEENSTSKSYSAAESHTGQKPSTPKAQCGSPSPRTKSASPKPNVTGDCVAKSSDKEGEKQQKQGRRVKPKAGSLPPSTRLGRTMSCTNNLERKGSSPKKKAQQIKSKVNSFRDTEVRVARPVVKRRSSSVGVLDTRTRLGRSGSQGKRKHKLSQCSKKPGESSMDKVTFMQEDVISPWLNEGMTSDDNSLMNRTIRNPRILPVPSSPEVNVQSPWRGSWSPSLERMARSLVSRNPDHSPCTRSSLFVAPSSSSHLQDFQFVDKTLTSPNGLKLSIVGKNRLPRVRQGSPGRPAPFKIRRAEVISQSPLMNVHGKPEGLQEHGKGRVSSIVMKEAFTDGNIVDSQKIKDGSTLQATAGDPQVSKPIVEMSMGEGDTRETHYSGKSPTGRKSSLKKRDKLVNTGSTLDHHAGDSSEEFGSLSSLQLASQVPSNPKSAKHKIILLQQQQQPLHVRRVNLQHLRQFRLHSYERQRQFSGSTRRKKPNRCTICNCIWALTALMFFVCIGLYLKMVS